MIKAALNYGTAIPVDSRREVLAGNQYTLHQQNKKLLRERSDIRRRHESANATSRILQDERSNSSHTGGGRRREPNRGEAEQRHKDNHDSSFLSVDEIGNIMPKTPEAALVAAQAHLFVGGMTPDRVKRLERYKSYG
jgi:hypothetical protein